MGPEDRLEIPEARPRRLGTSRPSVSRKPAEMSLENHIEELESKVARAKIKLERESAGQALSKQQKELLDLSTLGITVLKKFMAQKVRDDDTMGLKHRLAEAEANMVLQTKHEMARSEVSQASSARMAMLEVELSKIRSSTQFQKEELLSKEVGLLREEVALQRDALVRRDEILAEKNLCIVGLEKLIAEERYVAQDSHERVSALYHKEEWNGIIKTRQLIDTREELQTVIKSKTPEKPKDIFAAPLLMTKLKNSTFTKECLRNMASLATQLKAFDIENVEREEGSPQSELLDWLDTANAMLRIQIKSKKGKVMPAPARSHEVREHLELSYGVLSLALDTLFINIVRYQVAASSFSNMNVELSSANSAQAEEIEKLKKGMVQEDRRAASSRQQAHTNFLGSSRAMNFLRSPKPPGSNPPRSPGGSRPVSRGSSQPSSPSDSPAVSMEPRSLLPARHTRAPIQPSSSGDSLEPSSPLTARHPRSPLPPSSIGIESPSVTPFSLSVTMPLRDGYVTNGARSPSPLNIGSTTARSFDDKSGPTSELPPLHRHGRGDSISLKVPNFAWGQVGTGDAEPPLESVVRPILY